MFNGHKPHHPTVRFFLYFAERRGPGCCCAWADQHGNRSRSFRAPPRATATWAHRVFSRRQAWGFDRIFPISSLSLSQPEHWA